MCSGDLMTRRNYTTFAASMRSVRGQASNVSRRQLVPLRCSVFIAVIAALLSRVVI